MATLSEKHLEMWLDQAQILIATYAKSFSPFENSQAYNQIKEALQPKQVSREWLDETVEMMFYKPETNQLDVGQILERQLAKLGIEVVE